VTYSIVLAGLTTKLFDRVRKLSENRLSPNGKLILKPTSGHVPYSAKYIAALLSASYEYVRTRDGRDGVATLLMYVDYADASTKNLLQAFFPFGLPLALDPVDFSEAKNQQQENALLNAFAKEVDDAAIYLRGLACGRLYQPWVTRPQWFPAPRPCGCLLSQRPGVLQRAAIEPCSSRT
jgi:hypothetical protein